MSDEPLSIRAFTVLRAMEALGAVEGSCTTASLDDVLAWLAERSQGWWTEHHAAYERYVMTFS